MKDLTVLVEISWQTCIHGFGQIQLADQYSIACVDTTFILAFIKFSRLGLAQS